MTMASELVQRLIAANEGSQQAVMGSDIFYKAAERIDSLERRLNEISDTWHQLAGNTTEPDAFGNVTIMEIDFNAIHKCIGEEN
jgi:hypothetical protein